MTTLSASLTNLTALLPHSHDRSLNVSTCKLALHRSDFSNTLIYPLKYSGTFQTCDIKVRFLNLLASENGRFVNIILLCVPRRIIKEVEVLLHYYSKPALQEVGWSQLSSCRFTSRKERRHHYTGG